MGATSDDASRSKARLVLRCPFLYLTWGGLAILCACRRFGAEAGPVGDASATPIADPGPRTWRLASSSGPSPRHSTHLIYHEALGKVVMLNGLSGANDGAHNLSDAWAWNGSSWEALVT